LFDTSLVFDSAPAIAMLNAAAATTQTAAIGTVHFRTMPYAPRLFVMTVCMDETAIDRFGA
jgi:hypothetical protein